VLNRRSLLLAAFGVIAAPAALAREGAPSLMLADVYRPGMSLDDYWVSEKYDGVRGYWDGKQLWTRGGERVVAPAWFTAPLPRQPLDGELWAGRGRFAHAVSTVRSQTPNDVAWHEMRFMVFDLPAQPGDFTTRLAALRKLLPITDAPWVVPVPQERATTHEDAAGAARQDGEDGRRRPDAAPRRLAYRGERNNDLLKVKPYEDAEARVIEHVPGKGKHSARLGALVVETADGKRFKLGTGLTDAERENPPAIGSWVTYRYNGTTAKGLPRFARFMRVREGLGPSVLLLQLHATQSA
jgi:DNA ligase-1